MLCPYKNIFGQPGQGVHSYRILDIAIVDVIFTILGAFLISKLFFPQNFWIVLSVIFLTGIVFHHLFCVRTTIDKFIFG
jgi:hypothetical protein